MTGGGTESNCRKLARNMHSSSDRTTRTARPGRPGELGCSFDAGGIRSSTGFKRSRKSKHRAVMGRPANPHIYKVLAGNKDPGRVRGRLVSQRGEARVN